MADRASASIVIGGKVTPAQFAQLCLLFEHNDLRMEWDGEPFASAHLPQGEPLRLYAQETPWGMFDDLEQYCCNERISYLRWSGSCPGSFGAERIVYDGKSGPLNFSVDDDDHLVLHPQTIAGLGSMRAIRRYIADAKIELPPFEVAGGVPPPD